MLAERLSQWWWIRIPLQAARLSPVFASGLTDGIYLVNWPKVAATAPPLALLLGLILGALHPGETFSVSLLVMALMIVAGVLSVHLGVWTITGYAVGDLFLHAHPAYRAGIPEALLQAVLPLFLSYFVLALSVVVIPLLLTAVRVHIRHLSLPVKLRIVLEVVVYLALGAGLVYLWALAAPVLIRPVFTWRGTQPTTAAIFSLQERTWVLSAIVVITAGVRLVIEERAKGPRVIRLATMVGQTLQLIGQRRRRRKLNRTVSLVARPAMITLLMAGMIASWLEGVLVFLFLALVLWGRDKVQDADWPWVDMVARIPLIVRFALGLGLSYFISRLVVSTLWNSTQSFRPVLIATVLSVAILTLATAVIRSRTDYTKGSGLEAGGISLGQEKKRNRPRGNLHRIVLYLLLIALTLALNVQVVYADNCGSLSDCFYTIAIALAVIAALALIIAGLITLPPLLAALAGGGGFALAGGGVLGGAVAVPAAAVVATNIATAAAAAAAAAVAAGAASDLIMQMSGEGTPGNNQAQNKQFRDAVRAAEKRLGRKLNKDQIRRVHDAISGENMGYHEIIEEILAMFGG